MPKETIIAQTQSVSGFQREMFKKPLKQLIQFLVTVANILAHADVSEKKPYEATYVIIPYPDKKMRRF